MEASVETGFLDLFRAFKIESFLGQGCFGKIHRIRGKRGTFALKKVGRRRTPLTQVLLDCNFHNRELAILQELRNTPGVLHLASFCRVRVDAFRTCIKRLKQAKPVEVKPALLLELDPSKSLGQGGCGSDWKAGPGRRSSARSRTAPPGRRSRGRRPRRRA